MFDDTQAHIEQAKLHATNGNDTHNLGRAMWLQAWLWHRQHKFGEAKSEALGAIDVSEKLGATDDAGSVRGLLQQIDLDVRKLNEDGELLTTVLLVVFIDASYPDRAAESE